MRVIASAMGASAAKAGEEAALGKVERQIKRQVHAIADGADAHLPLNAKLQEMMLSADGWPASWRPHPRRSH